MTAAIPMTMHSTVMDMVRPTMGMGQGMGKSCMGAVPKMGPMGTRFVPNVGTSLGTSVGPQDAFTRISLEFNWLLRLPTPMLVEVTRQHKLMHTAVTVVQGNQAEQLLERQRQVQLLLNMLAQRNLSSSGQRATRSGRLADGSLPKKTERWDICCVLDVLLAGTWPTQKGTQFLILWVFGDTTWEDSHKMSRDIGVDQLLTHLADVMRMRSHVAHDSRSLMGYDHQWMPENLRSDKHNYGHDPLFYSRGISS
jgi:hypothetical protein